MADSILVIRQFWPFCVNDAIEVHDLKTGLEGLGESGGQHLGRIAAAIGWVCIGKQAADVGQGGGAEDRIGDRMEQNIGVAMSDKLPVMRHIDTT